MALSMLSRQGGDTAGAEEGQGTEEATGPLDGRLRGNLGRTWRLEPGKEASVTFVVTWHFPNLSLPGFGKPVGRWYATRFADAAAVAAYVADNIDRLAAQTRLWRDTWYDSTLPYWLLDRLFLNTSILATSTSHRFADGRFYGWEGVGCCVGTCTHVWHYAHAPARLFPDLSAPPVRCRTSALAGKHGPGLFPRRNGRRSVRHRWPGRRRPTLLPRTSNVAGRRLSEAELAEDQKGDGIPDEPRHRP